MNERTLELIVEELNIYPCIRSGLGLRFLSRTVSLNHTYPDSGFLWFEFA